MATYLVGTHTSCILRRLSIQSEGTLFVCHAHSQTTRHNVKPDEHTGAVSFCAKRQLADVERTATTSVNATLFATDVTARMITALARMHT